MISLPNQPPGVKRSGGSRPRRRAGSRVCRGRGRNQNLASRTAESAKEIADLITESVAKVENGNQMVEKAGETLDLIVENTKETFEANTEVGGRHEGAGRRLLFRCSRRLNR